MNDIAKAAAGAAGNGNLLLNKPGLAEGVFKPNAFSGRMAKASRVIAEEPDLELEDADQSLGTMDSSSDKSGGRTAATNEGIATEPVDSTVSQGNQLEIEDRAKVWGAAVPAFVTAYDKIQAFIAIFGFDKIVVPSDLVEELNILKEKYRSTGNQTEEERKRMFILEDEMKSFQDKKSKYAMTVGMAEPIKEAITIITKEVVTIKPPTFNPLWMVFGLLLIQPIINFGSLLLIKYQRP